MNTNVTIFNKSGIFFAYYQRLSAQVFNISQQFILPINTEINYLQRGLG